MNDSVRNRHRSSRLLQLRVRRNRLHSCRNRIRSLHPLISLRMLSISLLVASRISITVPSKSGFYQHAGGSGRAPLYLL